MFASGYHSKQTHRSTTYNPRNKKELDFKCAVRISENFEGFARGRQMTENPCYPQNSSKQILIFCPNLISSSPIEELLA